MNGILGALHGFLCFLASWFTGTKAVYGVVGSILSALLWYKWAYRIIGFFTTRKFKPAKNFHKYGIVIAARNEECVIGNLLDSIKKQDYPQDLITVFVVADNCTDKTAQIARQKGAICYERFDSEHRTKGYALQFLFDRIEEDYGREIFEGYFVFDADNLLKSDFVSKMNDAFDSGERIITSYRNTKNFDESWIASNYALHWLRSARMDHRGRSVLRLATNIQGTGFLFSNEIVKEGWKYTSLTEDRALTADAVAQGYPITYNDEAQFYDEQPVDLKIALRQRLRWSRGHLLAFFETGPHLFINIFFGKRFVRTRWREVEKQKGKKTFKQVMLTVLESIRHRFASYDTLMMLVPFSVIYLVRWIFVWVILFSIFSYANGLNMNIFSGGNYLVNLINWLFPGCEVHFSAGAASLFVAIALQLLSRLLYRVSEYLKNTWIAVYIFIMENRRIIKMPLYKKLFYILMWPVFDIIGRYTQYIAVFKKVEWKPIPHKSKITIDDLHSENAAEKGTVKK